MVQIIYTHAYIIQYDSENENSLSLSLQKSPRSAGSPKRWVLAVPCLVSTSSTWPPCSASSSTTAAATATPTASRTWPPARSTAAPRHVGTHRGSRSGGSSPGWWFNPWVSCLLTALPVLCLDPLDKGKCSASIPRYYYNVATKKCEEFSYSGCGGSSNNFVSRQSCMDVCVRGVWGGKKGGNARLFSLSGSLKKKTNQKRKRKKSLGSEEIVAMESTERTGPLWKAVNKGAAQTISLISHCVCVPGRKKRTSQGKMLRFRRNRNNRISFVQA